MDEEGVREREREREREKSERERRREKGEREKGSESERDENLHRHQSCPHLPQLKCLVIHPLDMHQGHGHTVKSINIM